MVTQCVCVCFKCLKKGNTGLVLTLVTAQTQVSSTGTVTDVSVPSLPALSTVGTGVFDAPGVSLPGAEAADTCSRLNLRQPPQVTTLSVHEEVPHAAHVAQTQRGGPDLGGEDESLTLFR